MTLQKKHFYTWCAGLIVHALLTVYRHQMPYLVWHGVETEGLKEFISFLEHLGWGPQLPAIDIFYCKRNQISRDCATNIFNSKEQTAKLHYKFVRKLLS